MENPNSVKEQKDGREKDAPFKVAVRIRPFTIIEQAEMMRDDPDVDRLTSILSSEDNLVSRPVSALGLHQASHRLSRVYGTIFLLVQ